MVLEHKRQPITVNIFHTLFIRLADGIAQDTRIVPAQYRTLDTDSRYGTGWPLQGTDFDVHIPFQTLVVPSNGSHSHSHFTNFSYIFAYAFLISVLRLQCSFVMPAVVVAAALVNDSGSGNTSTSSSYCNWNCSKAAGIVLKGSGVDWGSQLAVLAISFRINAIARGSWPFWPEVAPMGRC